ncbi:fructose-1,6-bisphosphatase class 1 [Fulvitalea axinellae]|uniref:Fructose-1,6-bisphosphatase class 1 n=1 Tax=Fulvitalea axinellae TaxID=1182444 RepID=A0AAU9CIE2_9BACT|nr:fructose-1,6-bisphosphatase class 1 [Fulvitalea axinellae]
MALTNIHLPIGIPLDRFIKKKQEDFPFATGELSQLLRDIALASKIVNLEIARSGLSGLEGAFGTQNVQGECQQKLDILANKCFIRALKRGGEVCALISEENEGVIDLGNTQGKYVVAMDPLDGSSNIDVNVSIGTIFSIYRRVSEVGGPVSEADLLQPGTKQVAAGYTLYGSSCMLVYTTGNGVNGFTYEPSLGEFFLSHQNIRIPDNPTYYSVNEGAYRSFGADTKAFIEYCKDRRISARYIGSLVADFHRNLLKGGIYIYPKTAAQPNGKLRLCYECNALAFIAEQAGGAASDGMNRIMEIGPEKYHQRSPFYVGTKAMVNEACGFIDLGMVESATRKMPGER